MAEHFSGTCKAVDLILLLEKNHKVNPKLAEGNNEESRNKVEKKKISDKTETLILIDQEINKSSADLAKMKADRNIRTTEWAHN